MRSWFSLTSLATFAVCHPIYTRKATAYSDPTPPRPAERLLRLHLIAQTDEQPVHVAPVA